MTDVLNVAEAKRRFSELIARVGDGERFVIARRGRPVLALVPPAEAETTRRAEYLGLAAFAGALADWPDFEGAIDEIVAGRSAVEDRAAPALD